MQTTLVVFELLYAHSIQVKRVFQSFLSWGFRITTLTYSKGFLCVGSIKRCSAAAYNPAWPEIRFWREESEKGYCSEIIIAKIFVDGFNIVWLMHCNWERCKGDKMVNAWQTFKPLWRMWRRKKLDAFGSFCRIESVLRESTQSNRSEKILRVNRKRQAGQIGLCGERRWSSRLANPP